MFVEPNQTLETALPAESSIRSLPNVLIKHIHSLLDGKCRAQSLLTSSILYDSLVERIPRKSLWANVTEHFVWAQTQSRVCKIQRVSITGPRSVAASAAVCQIERDRQNFQPKQTRIFRFSDFGWKKLENDFIFAIFRRLHLGCSCMRVPL